MSNDATVSYEEEIDHILIWLDRTIGEPGAYIHLKGAFSSSSDPKHALPVKLIDSDYDGILRNSGPVEINFDGVQFLLAAFTEIEPCIECFKKFQHKRIFFIVSGSLGRTAVPQIFEACPDAFDDSLTDEKYESIYVYCHNTQYQADWICDYIGYIQIFTHDGDLLARMLRDIGNYFVMIGKRLLEDDPLDYEAAYHRLSWAHELYQRHCKLQGVSLKPEFEELNELIQNAEDGIKDAQSDADD